MNEFNIITTYYNNKDLLLKFIDGFNHHKQTYDFLKLYIIDDGSQEYPAESFLVQQKDVHLYKVTEDLGFNSHGCRNLGMTVSDKDWNLLIDSDFDLVSLNLTMIVEWPMEETDIVDLSINSLFIHKNAFWSCKGYDEEYVNQHCGDRTLLDYFKENFNYEQWPINTTNAGYNRKGRKIVFTDVDITTYDDKNLILYSPKHIQEGHAKLTAAIVRRYNEKTFANKKTLCFPWTKVW
jgi:glycosyltransferase involved in cell wall biosynthesis